MIAVTAARPSIPETGPIQRFPVSPHSPEKRTKRASLDQRAEVIARGSTSRRLQHRAEARNQASTTDSEPFDDPGSRSYQAPLRLFNSGHRKINIGQSSPGVFAFDEISRSRPRPRLSLTDRHAHRSSLVSPFSGRESLRNGTLRDFDPASFSGLNLSASQQNLATAIGTEVLAENISAHYGFKPEVSLQVLRETGSFAKTDEALSVASMAAERALESYIPVRTRAKGPRGAASRPGARAVRRDTPRFRRPRLSSTGLEYTPASIKPGEVPSTFRRIKLGDKATALNKRASATSTFLPSPDQEYEDAISVSSEEDP
jgi:hypothetical protein